MVPDINFVIVRARVNPNTNFGITPKAVAEFALV